MSASHRATLNLGATLGGVVGGFLVHANSLSAFRWLFALNVATYLVFLAVFPGLPSGRIDHVLHRAEAARGFSRCVR